ncbi:MAG: serine/threonine-protein kinase, partial [Fuerstiella sp.]
MASDTVKSFLQALQQSKLLSDHQWKAVRALARVGRKQAAGEEPDSSTPSGNATSGNDPSGSETSAGAAASGSTGAGSASELKQLVVKLIDRKLLTSWQAAQLQKGQTGFVLGRYRLLFPIGKGGMGHVFKADTFDSDEVVAVKVMARKLTANESLVSRFRREIKASSRLDSQHVVKTLDAGRVGKVDFMVMEFVNGDQIDDIANRHQRLPVGMACEMIRQAAVGLQHAYEKQMVHRDIKPANLIVNWNDDGLGTVKLMDMGLVLIMSEDDTQQQMTRTGQVMGTPDYMSPEQGWDTTSVDIRGDIYSLGCSLF